MRDVYDLMTGMSYCAVTSRREPALDEPKKKGSLGEGLAIAIGFMSTMILMFAVA